MNFGAPTTNLCFVVFHFLGHASHELTARVNLQRVWPSQKAALVGGCLFFDAAQPAVLHPQVMAGKSGRPLGENYFYLFAFLVDANH